MKPTASVSQGRGSPVFGFPPWALSTQPHVPLAFSTCCNHFMTAIETKRPVNEQQSQRGRTQKCAMHARQKSIFPLHQGPISSLSCRATTSKAQRTNSKYEIPRKLLGQDANITMSLCGRRGRRGNPWEQMSDGCTSSCHTVLGKNYMMMSRNCRRGSRDITHGQSDEKTSDTMCISTGIHNRSQVPVFRPCGAKKIIGSDQRTAA